MSPQNQSDIFLAQREKEDTMGTKLDVDGAFLECRVDWFLFQPRRGDRIIEKNRVYFIKRNPEGVAL